MCPLLHHFLVQRKHYNCIFLKILFRLIYSLNLSLKLEFELGWPSDINPCILLLVVGLLFN